MTYQQLLRDVLQPNERPPYTTPISGLGTDVAGGSHGAGMEVIWQPLPSLPAKPTPGDAPPGKPGEHRPPASPARTSQGREAKSGRPGDGLGARGGSKKTESTNIEKTDAGTAGATDDSSLSIPVRELLNQLRKKTVNDQWAWKKRAGPYAALFGKRSGTDLRDARTDAGTHVRGEGVVADGCQEGRPAGRVAGSRHPLTRS